MQHAAGLHLSLLALKNEIVAVVTGLSELASHAGKVSVWEESGRCSAGIVAAPAQHSSHEG